MDFKNNDNTNITINNIKEDQNKIETTNQSGGELSNLGSGKLNKGYASMSEFDLNKKLPAVRSQTNLSETTVVGNSINIVNLSLIFVLKEINLKKFY
jgi:hypothetical protein